MKAVSFKEARIKLRSLRGLNSARSRHVRALVFCYATLLLLWPLSAEEAVPRPEDFAGTFTLTGKGGTLLRLEIPELVYRLHERPDRGDIRVFDAAGAMVPFVVRPVPGGVKIPPPEEVPFFLWKEEQGRNLPGGADIEINAAGAVIRIKNQNAAASAPPVYLLDLTGLSRHPAALDLEMDTETFFNTGVTFFSGADLNTWKEFDKKQIIAWYGDSGVSKTRVELPENRARYLLIRFENGELRPRRISALFGGTGLPPLRETIVSGEFREGRRVVAYNTGGFFPLSAVGWRLTEMDSIEVRVRNRMSANDDWNEAAGLTLFRLGGGNGEILYNKALETRSAAPFWELEARGEAVFLSVPECRLSWTAHELVFLGRGAGPWTLACGNQDWGRPDSGELRLEEYPAAPEIAEARITGESRSRSREPDQAGRDWGPWLLWAILIAAVCILLTLVFFTAKSMTKEKS